jgi:hypothetical protein
MILTNSFLNVHLNIILPHTPRHLPHVTAPDVQFVNIFPTRSSAGVSCSARVYRLSREPLISAQPGGVMTKFHRFSLEQFEGKRDRP